MSELDLLVVIGALAGLNLLLFGAIITLRGLRRLRQKKIEAVRRRMIVLAHTGQGTLPLYRAGLCLKAADGLLDYLSRDSREMRILRWLLSNSACFRYVKRRLRSCSRWKRAQGAHFSAVLFRPELTALLIRRLPREGSPAVIRQLAFSLVSNPTASGLKAVLSKAQSCEAELSAWLQRLLAGTGQRMVDLLNGLDGLNNERDPVVVGLICRLAPLYPRERFRHLLLRWAVSVNPVLARPAAAALAEWQPELLGTDDFFTHPDPEVRRAAYVAVARTAEIKGDYQQLFLLLLQDPGMIKVMTDLLNRSPQSRSVFEQAWFSSSDQRFRQRMTQVLAGGVEQYLPRLAGSSKEQYRELVKQIIMQGYTGAVISFLNNNSSAAVEDAVTGVIREAVAEKPEPGRDFAKYLNDRPLKKTGLVRYSLSGVRQDGQREGDRIRFVRRVLAGFGLLFALLFFYRVAVPAGSGVSGWIRAVVLDYSWLFIGYSFVLSLIYLLLLLLSGAGVRLQNRMRVLHSRRLLFRDGLLPGVAVLAPAFNEAASIVESVRSLLDLYYPDYRLIVINDGSKDETLENLQRAFKLYRVDLRPRGSLQTAPVRGVYRSNRHDRLLVIDKENGGKADSLNTGINFSEDEYFCGIDADSLLEREALLENASLLLDYDRPVRAVGGNVLPVNGSLVRNGRIVKKRIPSRGLPRLQTVEYLRAFMASRIGWAHVNGLMIISGAFGFFHRRMIEQQGGYLTGRERHHLDTVGEDMELVVRSVVSSEDEAKPIQVAYCAAANCWTEVPHELHGLGRQRDRWQRGLIEILSFHRRVLFNPRYGKTGMVALPWFFLFEMCGAVLELAGYLFFAAGLLGGVVGTSMTLLLLIGTLLLGTTITTLSQMIAESVQRIFPVSALLRMQLTAVLENIGYRQLNTWWRVVALWHSLRGRTQWGQPARQGFSAEKEDDSSEVK